MHRTLLPALVALSILPQTSAAALPAPTSEDFCREVQQILASTEVESTNTVFDNMPDYRSSKPMVDPLNTYQAVTYRGQQPIMVSCKVKGAAHIRAAFGADAAGEQRYCPSVTRMAQAEAVAGLRAEGLAEAADKAAAFVVDDNEPFLTGREYLTEFQLSYVGDDGAIHLSSPGLFHDYDSWTTWILPAKFEGQVYCHLATVGYIKSLATGAMEPGTTITTGDDAPVTPQ
jgi:hypothetical protein